MSFAETAALGAIAGSTIFLGLPVGRAAGLRPRARVGLSMLSAGILAFIFMDVGAEGSSRCSARASWSASGASRQSNGGWVLRRARWRRWPARSRR